MEYIFNQFEELQRPEQALLIWTVGAVLTFLIGLLLIKKGFWKESGSWCLLRLSGTSRDGRQDLRRR
jgi:hypothetical protein